MKGHSVTIFIRFPSVIDTLSVIIPLQHENVFPSVWIDHHSKASLNVASSTNHYQSPSLSFESTDCLIAMPSFMPFYQTHHDPSPNHVYLQKRSVTLVVHRLFTYERFPARARLCGRNSRHVTTRNNQPHKEGVQRKQCMITLDLILAHDSLYQWNDQPSPRLCATSPHQY